MLSRTSPPEVNDESHLDDCPVVSIIKVQPDSHQPDDHRLGQQAESAMRDTKPRAHLKNSDMASQASADHHSHGERIMPSIIALTSQRPGEQIHSTDGSAVYAESLAGGTSNPGAGVPFYAGKTSITHLMFMVLFVHMDEFLLTRIQIGDQRGPAFVIDICEPNRSSRSNHVIVSKPSVDKLLPEHVAYLRANGAFSLPPLHIQKALIRAYFHHVYPAAPILDTARFLSDFEQGTVSLLLLWAIFMAAGNVRNSSSTRNSSYFVVLLC
jgi:hypothetical protein